MRRPTLPSRLPVEPFVLLLVAMAALAFLLPATGTAATVVEHASSVAIGLLFFLYGVRLSTREALDGLTHWRLQLFIVLCTFVLFPLLGLAARALVPHLLTEQLYTGVLFLCLVPSTIQSSIAFTSLARGNVPAAICAGTYSALLGMVLTPLLAAWLIGPQADFSAQGLLGIATQLLAPFAAGQLLRRRIGGFVHRHRRQLARLDRTSILLVVYTAFSEGVDRGVFHQVTAGRLAALAGVLAALLATVLALTMTLSRRLHFNRADRITAVFAGSKKSLANGLPMAAVLFGPQASLAILPLMLFHQLQLIVCAFIAERWAKQAPPQPGG
ncbi:bile acid:sodium symporter family protein [Streptomyces polyrhachis]|uniref:Bile acid:sodium symporter family protein n=1 Tax=Streptomyces polyrhachis TaxID=1282885 RepID=A0ABW2GL02_9ACTN